jgi:cob(I)alamin adenosyltransferase
MLEKGIVQVYTGQGKGKTTAAIGLALRAAGRGNKVLIYQFLKPAGLDLGERRAIKASGLPITIEAVDVPWDMFKSSQDAAAVARAAEKIELACRRLAELARQKKYDVIVLDEIVFCLSKGLVKLEDIKRVIEGRDAKVELVLTGRGAPAELIELADLVSEVTCIKHPFEEGMAARAGIEY